MNEVTVFESQEFGKVRTVSVNDEMWFVGKDVCEAFGDTNYRRSLANIDEDEKSVSQIDTPGGKQGMTIVNEGGLYSLLFQMQPQKGKGVSQNDNDVEIRIEKLKRFKRWVTSEVLPSIRKHGMYAKDELLGNMDLLIAVATELKEEQERNKKIEQEKHVLEAETLEMTKTIFELQPKANYVDIILQSKSTVCITQIAQDYGMSAKAFNKILSDIGIQWKVGGQWILYRKYQGMGYVQSKTVNITRRNGQADVVMNTEWRQKGRLFLYEEIKKHGIYPMIEKVA